MNTYHIKQYYIDPQELQGHESFDEYNKISQMEDDEDIW
jgi:hypothetical protein